MKQYGVSLVIIIAVLFIIGLMLNNKIYKLDMDNGILNDSINTLNNIIHIKDSLFIDHLSNCYMISKDEVYYDKNGHLQFKTMRDLTFNR